VLALELGQPGRVYPMAGDAVQEEVIAEQSAGPAPVGAAGGVGDRVQVGGAAVSPISSRSSYAAASANLSPSSTPPPGANHAWPDWTNSSRSEASSSSTRADLRTNSAITRRLHQVRR
jgi:hypothetical protein